jgi:hypothetical protein
MPACCIRLLLSIVMQITTIRGAHKPEYRDKIIKSLKNGSTLVLISTGLAQALMSRRLIGLSIMLS